VEFKVPTPPPPLDPAALQTPISVISLSSSLMNAQEGRLRALVEQGGAKWSKFSALYAPLAPPPLFFDYSCRGCRFFESTSSTCAMVGRTADPGGAQVSPQGWCLLSLPAQTQTPLSWLKPFLPAAGPLPGLPSPSLLLELLAQARSG